MQQDGDFGSSSYYSGQHFLPPRQPPNTNPNDYTPAAAANPTSSSFSSAPPYGHYSSVDHPSFNYPSYAPPNPSFSGDPAPGSYPPAQIQSQYPPYQSFNPPPAIAPEHHHPQPQQSSYYPYESHHSAPGFENPNPNYSSNPSSYNPSYTNLYDNSGLYGAATAPPPPPQPYDRDFYERKPESAARYDWGGAVQDDRVNDGAYRYDGGSVEPYGARGTGGPRSSSSASGFDDYGRAMSFGSGGGRDGGGSGGKIVRAVPKMDTQQNAKNGVQKFRVKLLPEGSGTTTDVLCQIGLDGIRMVDPGTNRTLRIYPLETVTRWEVSDPSTYIFWSKASIDIEPRRIRLQSNRYTTNTILDTVTAATVQLKEMGGKDSLSRSKGNADAVKQPDQPPERKKGLVDWMNFIKPGNEEKDHWVPDEAVKKCTSCGSDFNAFNRRHHCRNCGDIFCDKCTQGRIALTADENAQSVRVCDRCMAETTQRLSRAKEAMNKPVALHTHDDLAWKLQEEMEKNRKSTGSFSSLQPLILSESGRQTREVACPTCTVHLQVQVPSSGSETIECGVCQHPFLVGAR